MKPISTLGLGAVAALAAAALVSAAPASATTCTYSAVGHSVSLDLTAPAPNTYTTLGRLGNRIVWHDGPPATPVQACGGADVFNTDTVKVTGTKLIDRLMIDLQTGPFSPGFAPEPGEIPEIEIVGSLLGNRGDSIDVLGTGANDAFYAGDGGFGGLSAYIGLNGDYDADVMMQKPSLLSLQGLSGNDIVSGQPGHGAPAPYTSPMALWGQNGKDLLLGGMGNDQLTGGPGVDSYRAMDGRDRLFAMDGLAEVVEGGLGIDWGQLDPFDVNLSVELP